MALSVLTLGNSVHSHGLYDSSVQKIVLVGSQAEMELIKHMREEAEQRQANAEHLEQLRSTYIDMLVSAGNSTGQAVDILKHQMPFLWTNKL